MKWVGKINFDGRPQYDADGLITNTEVDTISGSLQTNIDGKSDTVHLHDDRYYTESEVDTISGSLQTNIDGKSDTSHLHDDRYYTESEVDTISGSLQTNIDGKSDTAHLHDDRYYTESEVDTISGSLQTNIETEIDTLSEVLIDYSDYKSTNSFLSKDLLIYYGYLNSFNSGTNGWDNEKVARDMAQYNIIVFGAGVAATGHTDYANFIAIVARIKTLKPGIMLFGYVTVNQTLTNFQTQTDEWDVVSQIDGIFMDEAGYDYGKTRAELNDRVDYTHSLNCNICFVNAWVMEHIVGVTNDASYPNSAYNSTLTPSKLTENDWYLLESYPCNTTSYSGTNGYCIIADWLSRGTKAVANRDEFGINLANVSVIDKDDSDDTVLFDFHYLTALTFSLNAQGSSPVNYAASVTTVPFYTRMNWLNMGLTYETSPSVTVATDNWQIHYRYTDKGRIICDHTGSDPIITFDNNREDIISDITYGTTWSGITGTSPSKNAVYDLITTISGNLDDCLKKDGSEILTSDWDIGDGRKILADEIRARDAGGLKLYDDGGNGMFVEDNGNVGIGTTVPTYPLEVVAGNNLGVQVRSSIAATGTMAEVGFRMTISEGTSWAGMRAKRTNIPVAASTDLKFFTLGAAGVTDKMIIMPDGNVGIDTTIPTEKLDINSDAIRIRTAQTPATSSGTGNQGDICWDADYVYVCIDTNEWKRTSLVSW